MRTLRESALILLVGTTLGLVVGWARGFPLPPTPEVATCESPGEPQTGVIQWVDPTDADPLLGDPGVIFADARSEDEFLRGHIAGAISVPMDLGTVEDELVAHLAHARTVITYCDTAEECAGSVRLAVLLAEAGLRDVRVLSGGMPTWLETDRPAEAGECTRCP